MSRLLESKLRVASAGMHKVAVKAVASSDDGAEPAIRLANRISGLLSEAANELEAYRLAAQTEEEVWTAAPAWTETTESQAADPEFIKMLDQALEGGESS